MASDTTVPLPFTEFLTGREVLTFLGRLRCLEPEVVDARAHELLGVMDLLGAEQTLVVDYSTGMRKKIGLSTALLHNPKVLVLDEPFEAIDPVSAVILKRILTRFVAQGGAVVVSSHVMALVEQTVRRLRVGGSRLSVSRMLAPGDGR